MPRTEPHGDWIELIERLTSRASVGRGLDFFDTATIAHAVIAAVENDRPLEEMIGLPPQWRSQWRHAQRIMSVRALAVTWKGSTTAFATALHRDLMRYRASAVFRSARSGLVKPAGDKWFWHSIIATNGYRVPSIMSLRRMAVQSLPLGLISADDEGRANERNVSGHPKRRRTALQRRGDRAE